MGTPKDPEARRFYRVAHQRLEDGVLILRKLERANAAIYLTGYAVECILKALILVGIPPSKRSAIMAEFKGSKAHNIEWLRGQLAQRNVRWDAVAEDLVRVQSWSVELRYQPGVGDYEQAERFVLASGAIVKWADGRM